MPTTIKAIAARLGISTSTVSRALNDFPYVSEDVRRRVHEAARELNYHPNVFARGLRGMGSRVTGLIIPDLMNDFYAAAATVIQVTLSAEGYRLLLCVSGNDPRTELAYLRAMREERVQGLIWVPRANHKDVLREYADDGVPVVEFARRVSSHLDGVVADDVGGAHAGTEHLLKLGHTRIGLVVGQTELSTGRERLDGYLRAFGEARLDVDADLIKVGRFDRAWGRQATEQLLDLPEAPTALFATSSELVMGALRALHQRRVKVPQMLSLVGFGDPEWFAVCSPPITTVAFATEDMASAAVHKLLRRARERPAGDRRKPVLSRLSCHLVIRDSTAPLQLRPTIAPP